MSGIVTSTFKAGTGGCGGWSASLSFPGPSGPSRVFLTIFVLYSNDLPPKHSHQHHQFHLYNNSVTFLMSWTNFDCILTDSAFSINVLLIFAMHDLNGALFLNATFFWSLSFSFAAAAAAKRLLSLLKQYMHHYSHINVIVTLKFETLYFLLTEYWSFDKSFTSTHFFVTHFDTAQSLNSLDIL